ncbi:MAG: type I-C CRISPR-associated protein Cas5 [Verrucomicrobiales bacterium]|nr:type I-C CRISPR-associated protein Cas5 [Verrucomicrobiales bacterium]
MLSDPICLRVKGPFACFTRPEFHVERVSYPVIAPSAARGILEAILMKPMEKPEAAKRANKIGFRWRILRLGVVREGVLAPILRNELGYGTHQAYGGARGYDIMEARAQRHSLILRDVEYLIEAVIEVLGTRHRESRNCTGRRPSKDFLARNKYHQMFLRRAAGGQCYYQPFLGCREFSVSEWELVHDVPEVIPDARPERDFGVVFRDFDFEPVWNHWGHTVRKSRPEVAWSEPDKRPKQLPPLRAVARHGWITVSELKDGKVEESI